MGNGDNTLRIDKFVLICLIGAILILSTLSILPYLSKDTEDDWTAVQTLAHNSFEMYASSDCKIEGTILTSIQNDVLIVEMSGSFQIFSEHYDSTPLILYPGTMELEILCGEYNKQNIEPRFAINSLDPFQEIILLCAHNELNVGSGNFFIKLSGEKNTINENVANFEIWLNNSSGQTFKTIINFNGGSA